MSLFSARAFLVLSCILCAVSCAQAPRPATREGPRLEIGGGVIDIHIDGVSDRLSQEDLQRWIHTAADAVTQYFGYFPVKHVELRVTVGGADKVNGGLTFGGRRITIQGGRNARTKDLEADWRVTHDMVPLAVPGSPPHLLMKQEGLSPFTYPPAEAR